MIVVVAAAGPQVGRSASSACYHAATAVVMVGVAVERGMKKLHDCTGGRCRLMMRTAAATSTCVSSSTAKQRGRLDSSTAAVTAVGSAAAVC